MSTGTESEGHWDTLILPYTRFDSIPVEMRTASALYQWIKKNPQRFELIPEYLHTDAMRYLAMTETVSALSWISASTTPNYLSLVLEAVKIRPAIVTQVESEYLSEEFLFSAVQARADTFFYMMREACNRFNDLVSQRIVDVACSTSPRLIYKMHRDPDWKTPQHILSMITDVHVADSMRACTDEIVYLKKLDKLYVLTQMIRDGYWPAPTDSICKEDTDGTIQSYSCALPSPVSAWQERMKTANTTQYGMGFLNEKIHVFFEAVIKLYPITSVLQWFDEKRYFDAAKEIYSLDEILAWTDRQSQIRVLKEVFCADELKPHMKAHPFLKGIVLEAELGM